MTIDEDLAGLARPLGGGFAGHGDLSAALRAGRRRRSRWVGATGAVVVVAGVVVVGGVGLHGGSGSARLSQKVQTAAGTGSWADQPAFGADVASAPVTAYLMAHQADDPTLHVVYAGQVTWNSSALLPQALAVFADDTSVQVVVGLDGADHEAPVTVTSQGAPSGPALVLLRREPNPSLNQVKSTTGADVSLAVIAAPTTQAVTGIGTDQTEHSAQRITGSDLWLSDWQDQGSGPVTAQVDNASVPSQVTLPL